MNSLDRALILRLMTETMVVRVAIEQGDAPVPAGKPFRQRGGSRGGRPSSIVILRFFLLIRSPVGDSRTVATTSICQIAAEASRK